MINAWETEAATPAEEVAEFIAEELKRELPFEQLVANIREFATQHGMASVGNAEIISLILTVLKALP